MDDDHLKLKLVSDNARPEKPRRRRAAPKVSPYCPECNGSTWIYARQGRADHSQDLSVRVRLCVLCLSKGKMTTW